MGDTGRVAGTLAVERLQELVRNSLLLSSQVYRRRRGGDLQFDGARPGADWIAHGYFRRRLWMLEGGWRIQRCIWKRRWLRRGAGETCHSRPPEDAPQVWSSTLILVLKLWERLDSPRRRVGHQPLVPDLHEHVTDRTVQRWLRRAQVRALEVQQAIRFAVMERCEPRPVEKLFPSGLSPPERLLRRRWRDPTEVGELWRALAILFGGAVELGISCSLLLAEARGRSGSERTFPI